MSRSSPETTIAIRFPRAGPRSSCVSVLILACKYLHDANPTNKQWTECCRGGAADYAVNAREITKTELQTLCQMGRDLRLPEEDIYAELDHFLSSIQQQLHWLRDCSRLSFPAVPSVSSVCAGEHCSKLSTLNPSEVFDKLLHENSQSRLA